MTWDDIGFLLLKNKYNENSLIAEFYTKNNGKVSGIIFGGTSKKLKNYLQIGNKVHLNYTSKSVSKIGYFKVEIMQALSPYYFDNQQKLACISSAMSLIKILTAESQKSENLFFLIENFYKLLNNNNWIKYYIFWELELLKLIGYDLEFDNLVDKEIVDNQQKLACISSAMSLIKILTAESQKSENLFFLIENFYKLLKNNNWIKYYIFWELELLKLIGYDLEFDNLVDKEIINNQTKYFVKSSTEKRTVPNFLIEKNENIEDISTLLNALKLVGDYLNKTILKPNNLNYPSSRFQFISSLK